MNIKNKDDLLADFLDGLISEEALVGLYPELKDDLNDIIRAQSALGQLNEMNPQHTVVLQPEPSKKAFILKPLWLTAASVVLITGFVLALMFWNKTSESTLKIDLVNANTEEKLQAIVKILKSEEPNTKVINALLNLATNDKNSNVRYIALQKLAERPPKIDKTSLTQFIANEEILTNQIAWIELWINLYKNDHQELENWLNQTDRHPLVKAYGDQILKGL